MERSGAGGGVDVLLALLLKGLEAPRVRGGALTRQPTPWSSFIITKHLLTDIEICQ
jgi:hypothetical protein